MGFQAKDMLLIKIRVPFIILFMISFDFEFVYDHLYEYALRMYGTLALLRAWYMCFNVC